MSLRLQLLGTIALVLLGTLLLGAYLTYRHALNKIETEVSSSIAVGSRIAHNAIDDAEEVTNPRRRLELLVADFNGDRHLRAYLIEPNGEIGQVSDLSPPEDPAPEWLYEMLARQPEIADVPLPSVFDGIGSVRLQTDSRNEIAEVWEDVQLFGTILTIFCIAGVLVTIFVLGRALQPLRLLTAAFEKVGDGDYAPRIPASGPRELVAVAAGFNQMATHLSEMEERNRSLLVQLETVQEEERAELARKLHDEVSPMLFCVGVDARAIERLTEGSGYGKVTGHAKAIQDAVVNMKGNVKAILGDLRPSTLHALGLHGAIDDLVEFWKSRHARVRFDVDIPETSWGGKIDGALQAMIAESVSNSLKHSRASHIAISIEEADGGVLLTVTDDGGGLKRTPSGERGYGILGMKERAQNLGGTLSVTDTNDASGVVVAARLPVTARNARREANSDHEARIA